MFKPVSVSDPGELQRCQADVAGTELTEHRTHCDFCFNLKLCVKEQRTLLLRPRETRNEDPKSISIIHISCPVLACIFNCGRVFHGCKREEHEELCARKRVPCINSGNGCPFLLERRLIGSHLSHCPASVVVCTGEWNRKPLPPWESQTFERDETHLDVAALDRDKRTVTEFNQRVPPSLRALLKPVTNRHPLMPLAVSGNRIPNCILRQTEVEKDKMDPDSEDEDTFSSFTGNGGTLKSPPGLQESVCSKLKELSFVSTRPAAGETEPKPKAEAGKRKELSLVVDVISKNACKYINLYTFICGREFRRDEVGNHFRAVHTEVLTQLNGWLFRRCPLADYGCSFGLDHMYPRLDRGQEYKVVFNATLDSFCFTQVRNQESSAKTEDEASLMSLPFEVLVRLTKYLDPLSLNALSMTNRALREICEYVVPERGIIVFDWEKNSLTGKWEVAGRKWIFSSSFTPIRCWNFGDVGRISNHMATCPVLETLRHRPDKPFSYPITLDDL